MSLPHFSNKHKYDSLFTASEYIKYATQNQKTPTPDYAIICFQRKLMSYVRKNATPVDIKYINAEIYETGKDSKKIWIAGNFGIGAPVAAIIAEYLIALGVKKIIIVGTAGALQNTQELGSLVLCTKAIRDEGTSYHYLAPATYSFPSQTLTQQIEKEFFAQKIAYTKGISWTIDAPYRETKPEIAKYQDSGVLTVEMEAAALFALGEFHKTKLAAIFVISDLVGGDKWEPGFSSDAIQSGLIKAFELAKTNLLNRGS